MRTKLDIRGTVTQSVTIKLLGARLESSLYGTDRVFIDLNVDGQRLSLADCDTLNLTLTTDL